jgi:ABC-2 type transport system permease protein
MEVSMKRFWFYVRLYFLLTSQYLKSRMQYRFDFFVSLVSMILGNVVSIVSLWIVMSNIPILSGWSFDQLLFIYGFSLIVQSPFQICFDHIWQLHTHIIQGTFIKYYFKPLQTLFYYLTETIDLKGFGQLAIGISAFCIASKRIGLVWTPFKIIGFPLVAFGGSLVVTSIMLIAASSCFWIKDSTSVLSFIYNLSDNTRYPLDIYSIRFSSLL